jgi:hypothetical protein
VDDLLPHGEITDIRLLTETTCASSSSSEHSRALETGPPYARIVPSETDEGGLLP